MLHDVINAVNFVHLNSSIYYARVLAFAELNPLVNDGEEPLSEHVFVNWTFVAILIVR